MLHRLAAEADVFITNYPPQVRERLGITYDHLAPQNERLIYASFTGYGEKGEEANKPGFDSNAYWARSGLMDLVRADDRHQRRRARSPAWATIPARWRFTARSSPRSTSASAPARVRMSVPT